MNYCRWCLILFLAIALAPALHAQPSYNIRPLGFYDSEHTGTGGFQTSVVNGFNSSGLIIGNSFRFDGVGNDAGLSAWAHQTATNTTYNLSLTDAEHTSDTGYRYSTPNYVDDLGRLVVVAQRFNGTPDGKGQSTWSYSTATQAFTRMGFFGAGYSNDDGYQMSVVGGVTSSNDVLGGSDRFTGNTLLGRDAWVFRRSTLTTTQLGFTDAEHTNVDGYRNSAAYFGNANGDIIGQSDRFNGGATGIGFSAWLYRNGSTTKIGYTDAVHTSSEGIIYNNVQELNEAGQVIGSTIRFNGAISQQGSTAWVYLPDSATLRRIGLFTPEFIRADGYQWSAALRFVNQDVVQGMTEKDVTPSNIMGEAIWVHRISTNTTTRIGFFDAEHTRTDDLQLTHYQLHNATNSITGISFRFSGFDPMGESAWVYNYQTNTTRRIGLVGPEHTSDTGFQSSSTEAINAGGMVAGTSFRFLGGSSSLGKSAWVYRPVPNTTTDISLTTSTYTSSTGVRNSIIRFMNDQGHIVGEAERYLGGPTYLGVDTFFYDSATDQRYILQFSVRPSDQYSLTSATYLRADGLVLGYYSLFDNQSNDLGQHAFSWSVTQGFLDLGTAVVGGLNASGWSSLDTAFEPVAGNNIIGSGTFNDTVNTGMPYLLTPVAVPEASTWILCCLLLFPLGYYGYHRHRTRVAGETLVEQPE